MTHPKQLTDDELIERIASLAGAARQATAALVAHLAELEARDLHLAQGFRSLYGYCRAVLHLSEHESYNRMEAAHAARRFPVILALLAEGRLHLTAVCLLAPYLGDENHLALLGGAIHKSKSEVLELLARWFPRPDVAASVRRVPTPVPSRSAGAVGASGAFAVGEDFSQGTASPEPPVVGAPISEVVPPLVASATAAPGPGPATQAPRPGAAIAPLATDRYLVKFTASGRTLEKLRRAQELLSHSVPSGDVAEIFDRALTALLEHAEKQRHSATARPRKPRPSASGSRPIPAAVEREVWERDGGRCAFVAAATGRRCAERKYIHFHHLKPWAVGGPPTPENIALRCRAHNDYEARRYFGPIRAAMDEAATRSGRSAGINRQSVAKEEVAH